MRCGNKVSLFSVRRINETVRRVFGKTQMRLVKARLEKRVGTSCTKDPLDEGVLLLTGEGTTVHRLNGTGKSAVNRVDN